jgi:hydrogenase nickel incorporation protein HypA/HybF
LHELSIVQGILETVSESAEAANARKIIAVAGVVKDALLFSYELATEGTILQGSELVVEELPVIVFCPVCEKNVELPGIQSFRCPACHTASGDIRQGKELEVRSFEIEV